MVFRGSKIPLVRRLDVPREGCASRGHGLHRCTHSCQTVNFIVNRFFIFSYHELCHIVYRKIHKHLIKFIKIYSYTYINGIFIINFKYIQLITNLFITYVIIFNKLTK